MRVRKYINVQQQGRYLKDEEIDAEALKRLNSLYLEVYSILVNNRCPHHHNTLHLISLSVEDDSTSIHVTTCCFIQADRLEHLFETFPLKVTISFLRALDQRDQN